MSKPKHNISCTCDACMYDFYFPADLRSAIRPEDYDFLSSKQSTFEEQQNMTVVPNYDAPRDWPPKDALQYVVNNYSIQGVEESEIYDRARAELSVLRSRLSSVEQERDEARTEAARWRELLELTVAARSSSDQEGR